MEWTMVMILDYLLSFKLVLGLVLTKNNENNKRSLLVHAKLVS